jgi:hypothetical protein
MQDEAALKKLRVADLKALLADSGLDTSGKKDDLIARLLQHQHAPTLASPPKAAAALPKSPAKKSTSAAEVVVPAKSVMMTEAERRIQREARFGIVAPVVVSTNVDEPPVNAPVKSPGGKAVVQQPKPAGSSTGPVTKLNYSVCWGLWFFD